MRETHPGETAHRDMPALPARRAEHGQAPRRLVAAALCLLIVCLPLVWGQGEGQADRYIRDLGLYQFHLTPGTHYLGLPLAADSGDILSRFGPTVLQVDSLEWYSPEAGGWLRMDPQSPLSGDRNTLTHWSVIRVRVSRPLFLEVKGEEYQKAQGHAHAWETPLLDQYPDGIHYVALVSTSDVSLPTFLTKLENRSITVGRDSIHRWNRATQSWNLVPSSNSQDTLAPGAVLRIAKNVSSSTPEVVRDIKLFDVMTGRLQKQRVSNAPRSAPTDPGQASIPFQQASLTIRDAPFIVTNYEVKKGSYDAAGKPVVTEGRATLELPSRLLDMTDLPTQTAVTVKYKDGTPLMFKLHEVTSLKVGSGASFCPVEVDELFMSADKKAQIYGKGKTAVTFKQGSGQFVVARQPVDIFFDPKLQEEEKYGGSGRNYEGPVFDISIQLNEHARAFKRWAVDPDGNGPGLPCVSTVTTFSTSAGNWLYRTRGWWVEYSKDRARILNIKDSQSWRDGALQAELWAEIANGKATTIRAEAPHVTSARIWARLLGYDSTGLPMGISLIDPATTATTATKAIFHGESGLIELIDDGDRAVSWQVHGKHLTYLYDYAGDSSHKGWSFGIVLPGDPATIFSIAPHGAKDQNVSARGGSQLGFGINPTFFFRGEELDSEGVHWKNVIFSGQIIAGFTGLTPHRPADFMRIPNAFKNQGGGAATNPAGWLMDFLRGLFQGAPDRRLGFQVAVAVEGAAPSNPGQTISGYGSGRWLWVGKPDPKDSTKTRTLRFGVVANGYNFGDDTGFNLEQAGFEYLWSKEWKGDQVRLWSGGDGEASKEVKIGSLNASFQFPGDLWPNRNFTGQLVWSRSHDNEKKVHEDKKLFNVLNLVSVKQGDTIFDFEQLKYLRKTTLDVEKKKRTDVDQVDLAFFVGQSPPAGDTSGVTKGFHASVRGGFQVERDDAHTEMSGFWEVRPVTAQTRGWADFRFDADCSGVNLGNEVARFDNFRLVRVPGQPFMISGEAGFRARTTDPWGAGGFAGILENRDPLRYQIILQLADFSPVEGWRWNDTYAIFDYDADRNKNDASGSDLEMHGGGSSTISLGDNREMEVGLSCKFPLDQAGFRLAYKPDFNNENFELKGLSGGGTFQKKDGNWTFSGDFTGAMSMPFMFDVADKDKRDYKDTFTATLAVRDLFVQGTRFRAGSSVGVTVQNIVGVTIPDDGRVQLSLLEMQASKIGDKFKWDYKGAGSVTLPSSVEDFKDFGLNLPRTMDMVVSGSRYEGTGALHLAANTNVSFGISDSLSLKIGSITVSRASPWGVKMGASLMSGNNEYPGTMGRSPTEDAWVFALADQTTHIQFDVGGEAVTLSGVGLKIHKVNGMRRVSLYGTGGVHVAGKDLSGTMALAVGTDKSLDLSLSNVQGLDLSAGEFTVTPTEVGLTVAAKKTTSDQGFRISVAVTIPSSFPGIGGQTITGTLRAERDGDFKIEITTNLPNPDFGNFPFQVALTKFILEKDKGKIGVAGEVKLRFLPPISEILGGRGDDPVEMTGTLAYRNGQLEVAAVFNPPWVLSLDMGVLGSFTITPKSVGVSTRPSLNADLELKLQDVSGSPTLDIAGSIEGTSIAFAIQSDPPLEIEIPALLKIVFNAIGYKQAFPGFMGVFVDSYVKVGNVIFGFLVNAQQLTYILPTSLPPAGFAFFEELGLGLKILGFTAVGSFALPPPQPPSLDFAKKMIKFIIEGFKSGNWGPLETHLNTEQDQIKNIFKGPGVGMIKFGLPYVIRSVFPDLQVGNIAGDPYVLLPILDSMYYLSDAVSGSGIATAIVDGLKFVAVLAKVFTDPENLVYMIPEAHRSHSFNLEFLGFKAGAGYSIEPTVKVVEDGSSGLVVPFHDLDTVATWVGDQTNVAQIEKIVAMERDTVNTTFAFTTDFTNRGFSGRIDDRWIDHRQYITGTLDLMNRISPPDQAIDADRAFAMHLKEMRTGGLLTQENGYLVNVNRSARLQMFGSTPFFQVKERQGREEKVLFQGSVPLMESTTRTVDTGGKLELRCRLEMNSNQLMSTVTALRAMKTPAEYEREMEDYRDRLNEWQVKTNELQSWEQADDRYRDWVRRKNAYDLYQADYNAVDQIRRDAQGEVDNQVISFWSFSVRVADALRASSPEFVRWAENARQDMRLRLNDRLNRPYPNTVSDPGGAPPLPGDRPSSPGPRPPEPLPPDEPRNLGVVSSQVIREIDQETFPNDVQVAGWKVEYFLDAADNDPPLYSAHFTDYGTVKLKGPNSRFTAVYPGSKLADVRLALKAMSDFKSVIFEYDSSPYMLGLFFWDWFVYQQKSVQDSIRTAGKEVRMDFEPSFAANDTSLPSNRPKSLTALLVLEKLSYYLAPQDPSKKTAALTASRDIEQFYVDGSRTLRARPFTVSIDEAGNTTTQPIKDLRIFTADLATHESLQTAKEQRSKLKVTDIQQFEKHAITLDGDPMIVRSLRFDVAAGQILTRVRSQSLSMIQRSNGLEILHIGPSNLGLMDRLMNQGPYGDPAPYPSDPGKYITLSYKNTGAATSALALHEALGSNVLFRTVAVTAPSTIAGSFVETGDHELAGSLGTGQVTADQGRMTVSGQAVCNNNPRTATLIRTPTGGVAGTVRIPKQDDQGMEISGEDVDSKLVFEFDNGLTTGKFKYPTGRVIAGGFTVNGHLNLDLPGGVIGGGFNFDSEIRFDGYFRFAGDVNVSIFSKQIASGKFLLDRYEGLYIRGGLNLFSTVYVDIEGRIHPGYFSFRGDVQVPQGSSTGIDGTVSIDSRSGILINASVKVAGLSIFTGNITINGDMFKIYWGVGGGSVGVSVELTFTYGGSFSIWYEGRAWLDTWLLGTISVGIRGSYDARQNEVCVGAGILDVCLNLGRMSIRVDW